MRTKTSVVILITAILIFAVNDVFGKYSGGTGESTNPYIISTAADMQEIGLNPGDWGSYFLMVNDVDLAGYDGHDGRPYFNMVGNDSVKFTGVFDGDGHKIINFKHDFFPDNSGIFRYVNHVNAQIKNVEVKDPNINMPDYSSNVGSLVGWLGNGTISNCRVTGGSIIGYNGWGGLVGFSSNGIIDNCHSTCNILGSEGVGGLVGENQGTISNCSANGNVSGRWSVGGLAGKGSGDTCRILNSYATGPVSGVGDIARNIGGLVGLTEYISDISNCYATGEVRGKQYIGGLVGESNYGSIRECYSAGDVNGVSYVGGLCGIRHGNVVSSYSTGIVEGKDVVGGLMGAIGDDTTIERCFALGNVSGNWKVGGLIGYQSGDADAKVLSSYSKGDVYGTNEVGGLVGNNYTDCVIRNSYSQGDVSGIENIGGLVGLNAGFIEYSYCIGDVTGTTYVGGLIGYEEIGNYTKCFWNSKVNPDVNGIGNTSDSEVIGKSTIEMQTLSTFAIVGWNFEDVWDISENQTYPYLKTGLTADLNHDTKVDFGDFAVLASHWLEGVSP